jgi:signal transduction histidine kinase
MGTSFGSRTLLTICGALVVLLGALAAVQYRWSTRVAAADVQREKEHLDSAASLFGSEFNGIAAQAMQFLQNDAHAALQSGERLTGVPKLIGALYYLDVPAKGERQVRRLTAEGLFAPSPLPEWIPVPRCAPLVIEDPPLLVAPIYDIATTESHGDIGDHFLKTFRWRADRCFVAGIDQTYLRDALFPQLIRQSFGETAAAEYDFAVVSLNAPGHTLYGAPVRADLRKPFLSIGANLPWLPKAPFGTSAPGGSAVLIQRVESVVTKNPPDLHGAGIWELQVAHKGLPLTATFERIRRRDLLLSLGVELLLVAAILFLVIAARRMQRLADQKMRFVAGVSHELRTPVSAIAMLSRNQADGLVAGAEKVMQYGELIHQQSRRLNEMVEQTLQYAGIHSGLLRPAKNEIDLGGLIQEAVDARREELAHSGFEVEIALSRDLPPVLGDAKLLRTAFDNLLDNALKYAGGGRWIRVSAGHAAPDKEVHISVEDRGAGIDPADQAEIFEPFCRGKAAVEAQIPGSGLGLSLVRSAAEAHRGSVTLVSVPGRGSTFTMHLPV